MRAGRRHERKEVELSVPKDIGTLHFKLHKLLTYNSITRESFILTRSLKENPDSQNSHLKNLEPSNPDGANKRLGRRKKQM